MIEQSATALKVRFKCLLLHIFGLPGAAPGNKYGDTENDGKDNPGQGVGKRIIFAGKLHQNAGNRDGQKTAQLRADHAHAGKAAALFVTVSHLCCQRFPRHQHHG